MRKEIVFYKKGYRVTESGNVIGIRGNKLNPSISNTGYYRIGCRYNKKVLLCSVHRLHAYQKYGTKLYEKGIQTRHKNNIRTDNSFDNILIGTQSENMMDMCEAVRVNKAIYASSFIRKYDKQKVIAYHKLNGNSYKKTMDKFEISSKGTLHYILNKKTNVL